MKPKDLTILVVDDQQSMRGLTRYALQQIGIGKILEAKSGRDAFTVLEQSDVHAVLSDWNMEDIDGLTLLKVVRKHPRFAKMPFVMLTGQSDRENVQQAAAAGVSGYLVKPFDVASLKKRLEQIFGPLAQ
ncbi:MAG TPA: hypothetical protein DCZ49_04240 [Hyphomonadaceae bacterium]|nr:hypothetical protein [Hyphomonadaceae bacterium]